MFFFLSDTATTFSEPDSSNASGDAWPGGSDWQSANPGDSIISDCKNWYNTTDTAGLSAVLSRHSNFKRFHSTSFSTPRLSSCEAGVLQCQSVPGCHVDGGWSQWGSWTECSHPCGGGVKFRRRHCDNPSPQSGGRGCLGVAKQQRDCNTHLCTGSPAF